MLGAGKGHYNHYYNFIFQLNVGVIADYNGNELIFIYKHLFSNRKMFLSTPTDNRRSSGFSEELKRSPFANNLPK